MRRFISLKALPLSTILVLYSVSTFAQDDDSSADTDDETEEEVVTVGDAETLADDDESDEEENVTKAEAAPVVEKASPSPPVKVTTKKESEQAPREDEKEKEAAALVHAELDEVKNEQAVLAALADAPDPGPSLTPVKLTTSTWSRFEMRENYDDLGVSRGRFQEGDLIVFRSRLGIQTNPLPITDGSDVIVQFTPQASGMWGQNGTIGEANVGVYEGYFKVRSERLDVQVGRIMMNYGDSLIIGNLDWHQTARAFDGVRVHYKMNKGYLDVFGTQVAEAFPFGGQRLLGGDQLFWGAYAGVGEYIAPKMELDAYFLGLTSVRQQGVIEPVTGPINIEGANLFTAGLRAKQQLGIFDYRFEGGVQFGQSAPGPGQTEAASHLAYQADGELGLAINDRTRVALGGLIASGDNPDTADRNEGWNDLYPTGHKFLGLMDVIGARSNVASGFLKLSNTITPNLRALLDAHLFARVQDGAVGVGEAGLAGSEFDFQLIQKFGKYTHLRGLYGLFIPMTAQYPSDNLAHYVELETGVVF